MCPKDADGMANSVDPDQTAPPNSVGSDQIAPPGVCPGLSVRKLRNITVAAISTGQEQMLT